MKFFLTLLMCVMVTACDDDEKEDAVIPDDEPVVVADLTYLNGSTVLGEGVGSSLEADTFLQCHTLISKFIPKILKNTLVAFGGASGARCDNCTISYNCVPGETVTLDYSTSDSATSPADYETNIDNAYDFKTVDTVCPESGISTFGDEGLGEITLKVTVTGELGSDTEYLDCADD